MNFQEITTVLDPTCHLSHLPHPHHLHHLLPEGDIGLTNAHTRRRDRVIPVATNGRRRHLRVPADHHLHRHMAARTAQMDPITMTAFRAITTTRPKRQSVRKTPTSLTASKITNIPCKPSIAT